MQEYQVRIRETKTVTVSASSMIAAKETAAENWKSGKYTGIATSPNNVVFETLYPYSRDSR